MRKTREVLRLYFELKLGQRQIARSPNVSQSTVHDYLERFRAAELSGPLPAEMSEAELERALFPADPSSSKAEDPNILPDFTHIPRSCSGTSTRPGQRGRRQGLRSNGPVINHRAFSGGRFGTDSLKG